MKKCTKVAIITALSLIIAGILIFTATMFTLGFDFSKLDNSKYTTNTYEYSDLIRSIYIDVDTTDVTILPASDNVLKVVCFEKEDAPHSVTIVNNALKINNQEKKWYEYISVANIERAKITLYVPDANYSTLSVETDTGDITINDITFSDEISAECHTGEIYISNPKTNKLSAEATTGHITIENVTPTVIIENNNDEYSTLISINPMNIDAETSTGDITFRNVRTGGNITAEASTGDIKFEKSDAENIHTETSTGDITGFIISEKTFKAHSSTGKVNVPETTGDGVFEAETSTGDINITYSEN